MQIALLAAVDWGQLLLLLIFVLGPMLIQLFNKGGAEQPQPNPQPQPKVRPEPPAAANVRQPGQPQPPPDERLEAEIREFLARSGRGGPPPSQEKPPQKRPSAKPTRSSRPVTQRPLADWRKSDPMLPETVVVAQPVDGSPHQSVAEHVQQHMSSNPIGRESSRLGSTITNEVNGIESRVHQVFDHQIGSLGKSATNLPQDVDDSDQRGTDSAVWDGVRGRSLQIAEDQLQRSENIRRMLSDPESVKQAIILSEILRRPNF